MGGLKSAAWVYLTGHEEMLGRMDHRFKEVG
jgi:hypothetical protein